ncbi:MAG: 23S rRNA (pseudouridine(1915)-N(3))-methyltransferase RlmH [Pseudomonadota bacterium]
MFSKIIFLNFGKFKSKEQKTIYEDYVNRLTHYAKVEIKELKVEYDNPEFFEKIRPKIEEALKSTTVMALSERGRAYNTAEFSNFINSGTGVLSVVVGTSWGIPKFVEDNAKLVLSFGNLTLPHEAVRVLSAEQLYRAYTVIRGESYHK